MQFVKDAPLVLTANAGIVNSYVSEGAAAAATRRVKLTLSMNASLRPSWQMHDLQMHDFFNDLYSLNQEARGVFWTAVGQQLEHGQVASTRLF